MGQVMDTLDQVSIACLMKTDDGCRACTSFELCTGRAVTERVHELRMELLQNGMAGVLPVSERVKKQRLRRTKKQDEKTYPAVPEETMELLMKHAREQKIQA